MIVLTPGVLVNILKPIVKNGEEVPDERKKKKGDTNKVYPIEMYVGGSISNIGIDTPVFSDGANNGILTFFYENAEL